MPRRFIPLDGHNCYFSQAMEKKEECVTSAPSPSVSCVGWLLWESAEREAALPEPSPS
jgi:hypothetical protein